MKAPQALRDDLFRRLSGRLAALAIVGGVACAACSPRSSGGLDHQTTTTTPVQRTLPDVPFEDQNGNDVHFYSDLVKDKTVVVSFIFTSCKENCPLIGRNFVRLQHELAARGETSVHLISMSVDPEDTPARLKEWATQLGAEPGWTLLSGSEESRDAIARALVGVPLRKGGHVPAIFVGNDSNGRWTRTYGLESPGNLIALTETMKKPFDPNVP